jgi:hypothetical protein
MEYSGIQFDLTARHFVSPSFSESLSCYHISRLLNLISKQNFIH